MALAFLVTPTPSPSPHLAPSPSPSGIPCVVGNPLPGCIPPSGGDSGGLFGWASDPLGQIATSFQHAFTYVLSKLSTFWVYAPTQSLTSKNGQPITPVAWLQTELHWFVGAAAVFGLLLAAARMAWQRNGEPLTEALSGFLTLAVVTGCAAAAVTLATKSGDSFSEWIVKDAIGSKTGDFSSSFSGMAVSNAEHGFTILLFLLATLSALVQIGMMLVRSAMLGLLTGFLPLAAAASIAPQGRVWFKKLTGWLVAFALYKPVAAVIYAYAIISLKSPDGTSQITGTITIILAVVALPALMKFAVPMVSATGGGSGAGAAVGGAAAAMGARMVASSGGGGGGGGAGSQESPADGARQTPSTQQSQQPGDQNGPPTPEGSPQQPSGGVPQSGAGQPQPGGEMADGAPPVPGEPITTVIGIGVQVADAASDAAQGAAQDSTGEGADGAQ
jgi:type IV secretion system protein TrbL